MKRRLPRQERLKGTKAVQELFSKGSSVFLYPYKAYYMPESEPGQPTRLLVSVPKRTFRKAVDRNRLKRRLRESYRANKHLAQGMGVLGLVYVGKIVEPSSLLSYRLQKLFKRLAQG